MINDLINILKSAEWSIRRLERGIMDGEDLFQDVCLTIWKRYQSGKVRNPGKLLPLIMAIARNKKIDRLRHNTKVKISTLDENIPVETKSNHQECFLARELIARLPNKYREILDPIINEGLSEEDVANRLGIPYETVRTRIKRAIKKIKIRNQESQN